MSLFRKGIIASSRKSGFWVPSDRLSVASWNPVYMLTGYSIADPVISLTDQSSNSSDFDQSVLSRRPLYYTGGQNGQPYLQFDGLSMYLQSIMANTYWNFLSNGSGMTIAIVLKSNNGSQGEREIINNYYAAPQCFRFNYSNLGSDEGCLAYSGGALILNTNSPAVGETVDYTTICYEHARVGNDLEIKKGGVLVGSSESLATPNTGTDATYPLRICCLGSAEGGYFNADIYDVMMFSEVSAELDALIDAYMLRVFAL